MNTNKTNNNVNKEQDKKQKTPANSYPDDDWDTEEEHVDKSSRLKDKDAIDSVGEAIADIITGK